MTDRTPNPGGQPANRFEWERIVRRLIIPVPTDPARRKKAPAATAVKLVAMVMATYANSDGTRVRPGDDRLSAVTGLSESVIKRCTAFLRSAGLIECVVHGSRMGRKKWASEYRLMLPDDLIDSFEMLNVDELEPEQGSPATCGQVVDEKPESDEHRSPATSVRPDSGQGQGSPATCGSPEQGSPAPLPEVARDPPPDQDHPQQPPEHLVFTSQQTVPPRGAPVDDDPGISESDEPLPDRCAHKQRARIRADGTSSCALCRREASHLRAV